MVSMFIADNQSKLWMMTELKGYQYIVRAPTQNAWYIHQLRNPRRTGKVVYDGKQAALTKPLRPLIGLPDLSPISLTRVNKWCATMDTIPKSPVGFVKRRTHQHHGKSVTLLSEHSNFYSQDRSCKEEVSQELGSAYSKSIFCGSPSMSQVWRQHENHLVYRR